MLHLVHKKIERTLLLIVWIVQALPYNRQVRYNLQLLVDADGRVDLARESLLLANLVLLKVVTLSQFEELKRLPLVKLGLLLEEVCGVVDFT